MPVSIRVDIGITTSTGIAAAMVTGGQVAIAMAATVATTAMDMVGTAAMMDMADMVVMAGMMTTGVGVAVTVVVMGVMTTPMEATVMEITAVVAGSIAPGATRTRWPAIIRVSAVPIPTPGTLIFTVIGRSGQKSLRPALRPVEHGMRAGTLPGTPLARMRAGGIWLLVTEAEPHRRKLAPTALIP